MDVTFAQITDKKVIKIYREQEVASVYKDYTEIEDMKVMVSLYPNSPTKNKKGGTTCNKLNKRKNVDS